jgi:hypothetical protein
MTYEGGTTCHGYFAKVSRRSGRHGSCLALSIRLPEVLKMLRRLERVVLDVKTHTALARELSLGLYEAFSALARGRSQTMQDALSAHDARIRTELPGF